MADIFSREKRSDIMSKIRGRETKIEVSTRKWLFSKGFRYKKNDKKLPGTPDVVLPKYKTVVLIHGCFWHGHSDCKLSHIPKTRPEYWENKINRNIERDMKNTEKLKALGWRVIVVWQCELEKKTGDRLELLMRQIVNDQSNEQ